MLASLAFVSKKETSYMNLGQVVSSNKYPLGIFNVIPKRNVKHINMYSESKMHQETNELSEVIAPNLYQVQCFTH